MQIPLDALSPSALRGLIEEVITREGTDYGERELSLEVKAAQLLQQLRTGTAVIVYDAESETCTIAPRDGKGASG